MTNTSTYSKKWLEVSDGFRYCLEANEYLLVSLVYEEWDKDSNEWVEKSRVDINDDLVGTLGEWLTQLAQELASTTSVIEKKAGPQ